MLLQTLQATPKLRTPLSAHLYLIGICWLKRAPALWEKLDTGTLRALCNTEMLVNRVWLEKLAFGLGLMKMARIQDWVGREKGGVILDDNYLLDNHQCHYDSYWPKGVSPRSKLLWSSNPLHPLFSLLKLGNTCGPLPQP